MRRIAGVTGAGPLWNRIMLHLYEHRDPPRFAAPSAADLDATRTAMPATSSAAYDEWRARQGDTVGALRVLFPGNGDVFENRLAANDPRRAQQQIEFRISRPPRARAVWTLNGARIAQGGGDAYFWPVRTGDWTLAVRSGRAFDTVHFRVIPARTQGPRGFAVAGR